jgi:hypothetical protein
MPADRRYLQPFKERCDLVVDNDHHYAQGLNALVAHLKNNVL